VQKTFKQTVLSMMIHKLLSSNQKVRTDAINVVFITKNHLKKS